METEKYQVNELNLESSGELLVVPVAATWPPAWLAALNSPPEGRQKVNPTGPRLYGWRLPNGTVVCRCCCPKPADSVPVVLADGDDGPQWVDEPTVTPSPTATSKAAAVPQPPSGEPQWL